MTVTSNHARNHKPNKTNTRNNANLNNNDDNNGAGSLSIGSGPSVASPNVHSSTNSTPSTPITKTTTTQSQSAVVKLSPAPSSTGSARTSSPIANVTIMKEYRDEPCTSRTPDMSFGSVPTAGGLKFAFEQQQQQPQPQASTGLVINTNTNTTAIHHALKESPPSSPGSEASARKRRKGVNAVTSQPSPHMFPTDHKESKPILQNGAVPPATHHMLGNQLNPNSSVAKNMADTLNMEIEAHSIYSHEPPGNLVGPQYPGRKESVRTLQILFELNKH